MRSRPFSVWSVDKSITERLDKIRVQEHYRGSMTSFIESILEKYVEGILRDVREVREVYATKVSQDKVRNEQRKAG